MFCGAGGASAGVSSAIDELGHEEQAWALNHWKVAISTHKRNFPLSQSLCRSLNDLQPQDVGLRTKVCLQWCSPSCTNFTWASSGRPRNDQLRAGPFAVTNWTMALMPDFVVTENVVEMQYWAPLDENGDPIPGKEGDTFRYWLQGFDVAGYDVEYRVLDCADYGDPTNRKRLFVIAARRGAGKVVWPDATHCANPSGDMFDTRSQWTAGGDSIDWDAPIKDILIPNRKPLGVHAKRMVLEGLSKFGSARAIIPHPRLRANARPASRPFPTITGSSNDIGVTDTRFTTEDGTPFSIHLSGAELRPLMHAIEQNASAPATINYEGIRLKAQVGYRMASVRELARGQSFPDSFEFDGTGEEARLQIGNAVPVLTAKAIARSLLTQNSSPTAKARREEAVLC